MVQLFTFTRAFGIIIWMILERIKIRNYRNYEEAEIFPSERLNLFVGDNAQGKTNLLESIYFASLGKSARTPRDKELIMWEKEQAVINARVSKRAGCDDILIKLDSAKRIAINGMPISRMSELMGVLTTVFFSPDELKIVKDGPSERRRFIDIALCQLSKVYFDCLSRYNKVLLHRNKLLKNNPTDDALEVWDMQLISEGAKVIKTRRGFVETLSGFASGVHLDITGGEHLELVYESTPGASVPEIADNLREKLIKSRDRDKYLCTTSAGPQRDDIAIKVNGIDLRSYGSQGQQRSAALSMKLAEMELLKEHSGEYPVLLLDDVLSELDESRQAKLLTRIKPYQTIITGTHITPDVRERLGTVKEYRVSAGKVTEA